MSAQCSSLFLLYTADLLQLVKRHQLIPHAYADDTQIYGFCRPADSADLSETVSVCVDEASAWMASNRLQLNHAKTEVLWCTSSRLFFYGRLILRPWLTEVRESFTRGGP